MAIEKKIQDILKKVYKIDSAFNDLFIFTVKNSYVDRGEDVLKNNPYAAAIDETMRKMEYELKQLKDASPYSKSNPERLEKLYHILKTDVTQLANVLKDNRSWNNAHWQTNFYKQGKETELNALVSNLYDMTHNDEMKKFTTEEIPETLHYFAQLEQAGKLVEEKSPKKKKTGAETALDQPPMQTAGTVVAAIAIIALAFTVLHGLNNLGLGTFGGALPEASTGFFLMPSGPYVTSLQMVLFMLVSMVLIVYIFGKAVGDW